MTDDILATDDNKTTLIPIKKTTRARLRKYLPMGSYDFGLNFLMDEQDRLKQQLAEIEHRVIELSIGK